MQKNTDFRRLPVTGRGNPITRKGVTQKAKLRAREPIGRSFGLIRGKFPSRKVGRMIHWESQIERDAVYLFEFSSGVTSYREQPLTTYYTLDGKTRRYTPDFELTLSTGEVVMIEVKPEEKLRDPDERRRLKRIQEHFASNGQSFRILTDREIRQLELLENLRMLMRHRGKPLSRFQWLRFAERLIGMQSISFVDAAELLGDITAVWMLIDERLLFCDLKHLVNHKTIFSTSSKGNSNEELFF